MTNGWLVVLYTAAGNMRFPTRKTIVEWVLKSRSQLSNDMIKGSFNCCGITIAPDGSEDEKLLVLKEGQPCASGLTKLKELRSILEEVRSVDPFEHVTQSDEEDASPNELFIDQDNDEDDMIHIDI